jgi:hypothetical protein
MSTPLEFLNREFRASFNFVYMTLRLSWRYLFLAYFTAVFFLALVWAGVTSGANCYDDMAFRSVGSVRARRSSPQQERLPDSHVLWMLHALI